MPIGQDVCGLFRERAAMIDTIAGQVGAKVGTGGAARLVHPRIGDFQQGAGAGVPFAKLPEIGSQSFREHDEIGLHISRSLPGRRTAKCPGAAQSPQFARMRTRHVRKGNIPFHGRILDDRHGS